jgi:vesicle coat complex subunit
VLVLIVQMISKGRDMSAFFAQVVKQVASPSIEIRKLASSDFFLP